MKVKINTEKCIGCGLCVSICEKVFAMKGDKAITKKAVTGEKCAKEAAESCPVNAIEIN